MGIIIIGRNESSRLGACLESVRVGTPAGEMQVIDVIYVDSDSSDNSAEIARSQGAHVVALQPSLPPAPAFTAARARNAGAEALLTRHPETTYLQFLDGDTELNRDWLGQAMRYLEENPGVAVACGRRREKFPGASVYNQLADLEWNTVPGMAAEFGGDALIRVSVFQDLHGYTPTFIAGEEPEFAARMHLAGHKIARLDHEMTLHDLHMTSFGQWWRRAVRSGHALAQLYDTHGCAPLFLYKRQHRSTLFWTTAIPAGIVGLAWLTIWWALVLLPLAYLFLGVRIMRHRLARGDGKRIARIYAAFTTLGKFAQLLGMLTYYMNLLQKRTPRLIEYKDASVIDVVACPPAISTEHSLPALHE